MIEFDYYFGHYPLYQWQRLAVAKGLNRVGFSSSCFCLMMKAEPDFEMLYFFNK
jgi:hypothetical protein